MSHDDNRAARLLAIVRTLAQELRPSAKEIVACGLDDHLERDYGLDSLARVELFARLEKEFAVSLGEAAFAAETPADLLRLLGSARAASSLPASSLPLTEKGFSPPPPSLSTLSLILDWHHRHQPDRTHLVLLGEDGHEQPVRFGSLAEETRRFAAGLLARGAAKGSRIALMLPTGIDFFIALHGTLYAGCVPVPLYPPVRPQQLVEHLHRIAGILANAGALWLIADGRTKSFAEALADRCPALAGIATVAEMLAAHPLAAPIPTDGNDLALLQYTSGSTGDPKGVMLTHANLLANIRAMQRAVQAAENDVFVSWLPLYHDMGLIGAGLGSFVVGFPLVLMSPLVFLAKPVLWLQAIARHRATLSGGPNFAYEICAVKIRDEELAGLDLSSWRFAFNGAEPVSPATLERFVARFSCHGFRREALAPVYGLAECAVGLTFPPIGRGPRLDRVERRRLADEGVAEPCKAPPPHAQEIVGCGYPLPGHEIRIVDARGSQLPERHVGRIEFRGPSASQGYYRNPEATAAFRDGEWRQSGDLGYLADGELFVTGREKDIIIRAGRNVYPQELETAIGRLPGVRAGNVAVFPATDPLTGSEKLVVLAEIRKQEQTQQAELRAAIDRLAIELLGLPPDEVILAPPGTVLKTSSGKIRRSACRTAYEHGTLARPSAFPGLQRIRIALIAASAWLRRATRRLRETTWGLWAWCAYALLALPFWLLIVALPTLQLRRAAARSGARLLLALTGLMPRTDGLSRLMAALRNGPVVIVANHASYLDGLVLTAVLPPVFAFVAKRELRRHPLSGPPLTRLGALFVERFDAARGAEDGRRAVERLERGESLVFFPEGTFSEAPGLLPFRLGAFLAAAKAKAAVIPLAIRGTRQLLPGERRWPRRHPLTVSIASPVSPDGADWPAILRLRDEARAAILANLGEPDAMR